MILKNVNRCYKRGIVAENLFEQRNYIELKERYSVKDAANQYTTIQEYGQFFRNINRVYVYGAGKTGVQVAQSEYFKQLCDSSNTEFGGFVLTKRQGNNDMMLGKYIYEIIEIENTNKIGILVAMNFKNFEQVKPVLSKYKNVIYI